MTTPLYEFRESAKSEDGIKYFFVSKGKNDIIKAVHYMYTGNIDAWKIYNLGFGDYQLDFDEIDDRVNTDNGDVYKVFNTVLNTIPVFFEAFPDSAMIVQGSDSSHDFYDNCKPTCRKKCENICKNQHRRINAYSSYVNKNYDKLVQEYTFFGGVKSVKGVEIEGFVMGRKYDAVLVIKKKCNFI